MTQRQPRLRDEGYLRWLRLKPCCVCGKSGPSVAAHLRAGNAAIDKPMTGIGTKPSDFWCNPLCPNCHIEQHAYGDEVAWWGSKGIDPFVLAIRFYAEYGGLGGAPRKRGAIKARKPRGRQTAIQRPPAGQQKPWPKRKIVSRGFK